MAAGAAEAVVFKAKGPVLLESILVSELRLLEELAFDSRANLEVGRFLFVAESIARAAAAARPPRPPLLPAPRPLTDRTSG